MAESNAYPDAKSRVRLPLTDDATVEDSGAFHVISVEESPENQNQDDPDLSTLSETPEEIPMEPKISTEPKDSKPQIVGNIHNPRKFVGFAPEPQDDLLEHHRYLEKRRKEKLKENPFWKIPSEFAYLDRSEKASKAVDTLPATKTSKSLKFDDVPDRARRAVKEISTVNRSTVINFHYFQIRYPLLPNQIMVEVSFASLSSMDITKLNKYSYNISDEKVGLGYDFVGIVSKIGRNVDPSKFNVGTKVFGLLNPALRKGALQTCIVVNPSDILILIDEETFSSLKDMDARFNASSAQPFAIDDGENASQEPQTLKETKLKLPSKELYDVPDVLTPMAKFCTFGSIYCRAKQALATVDTCIQTRGNVNILINGADTTLGYTMIQILASSIYSRTLLAFNIILVVRQESISQTNAMVSYLGESNMRRFSVISFNEVNDKFYLKGEAVPFTCKLPDNFATEIFQAVLAGKEPHNNTNSYNVKLDLFVDIIGSKKMFQGSVDMSRICGSDDFISTFGKEIEPLLLKLMKPKTSGCAYVSYKDFQAPEPTYLIDILAPPARPFFNIWSTGWTLAIANQFVSHYTYYNKLELEVKAVWVKEGFTLLLQRELRMKVDKVADWRNDFRKEIAHLRHQDGTVVFKIEAF